MDLHTPAPDGAAKHKPKRNTPQKEADRLFIAQQLLEGATMTEITEALNKQGRPYTLSRSQVAYDSRQVRATWRERATVLFDDERAEMLAQLLHERRELWKAWEKSKNDAVKRMAEQRSGGTESPGIKSSVTTEGQYGDVQIMREITAVNAKIADLLGINAPSKSEFSGPAGAPIQVTQTPFDPDTMKSAYLELAKKEVNPQKGTDETAR